MCLLELVRGLKDVRPDVEIYIIFPAEGPLIELFLPYIDGHAVIHSPWMLLEGKVNVWRKLRYWRRIRRAAKKMSKYIEEVKPDLTVTNTIVSPALALASRKRGVRHVWFLHEVPDLTWPYLTPIAPYWCIYRMADRLSRRILSCSLAAKGHYSKFIDSAKIGVVDQSVKLAPESGGGTEHEYHFSVASIGSFDPNKGFMELMQATDRIVSAGRPIHVYLVGCNHGLGQACHDYIMQHNLEAHVSIVPFTPHPEEYYRKADVVAVCSGYEAFGRVAVEAMAQGTPVILSNVGANPERIADGVQGLLYEKGKVDSLVNAIETMRDSETRKRMSQSIDIQGIRQYYSTEAFALRFIEQLAEQA